MKKLIFPLILLAIVLSLVLYYNLNSTTSTLSSEDNEFAVEDTASITKIFLADKENKTTLLERSNNGGWKVNRKYKARPDAINNLLETMKRVSIKAPVPKSAFENIVKQLAIKSVKVEIYMGSDKPEKVYYVGGPNQQHTGTYMLMEKSISPYLMHIEGFHGFLTPRYFTNANEWRNNIICNYKFGDIAEVNVQTPREPSMGFIIRDKGNNAFSLYHEDTNEEVTDFNLDDVRYFIASFTKVPYESFEETKTDSFIDSVKASSPVRIITIIPKHGSTKQLKLFLKPAPIGGEDLEGNSIQYDMERLYCSIDDKKFVVVQYFIFDKFLVTLDHFLRKENVENS